jgi:hypothetical protein
MLETVENLKAKYELELNGSFDLQTQGDTFVFRYHSPNSAVGVVSSRSMREGQYVADLLSFMECVALLESTLG